MHYAYCYLLSHIIVNIMMRYYIYVFNNYLMINAAYIINKYLK